MAKTSICVYCGRANQAMNTPMVITSVNQKVNWVKPVARRVRLALNCIDTKYSSSETEFTGIEVFPLFGAFVNMMIISPR
jgi:hypothetical protein